MFPSTRTPHHLDQSARTDSAEVGVDAVCGLRVTHPEALPSDFDASSIVKIGGGVGSRTRFGNTTGERATVAARIPTIVNGRVVSCPISQPGVQQTVSGVLTETKKGVGRAHPNAEVPVTVP